MNLERAIKNGFQKLKKSNIRSALIDSEILLSDAIHKSREYIILNSKYHANFFDNLLCIIFDILFPHPGSNLLSACRNKSQSPFAFVAPIFN